MLSTGMGKGPHLELALDLSLHLELGDLALASSGGVLRRVLGPGEHAAFLLGDDLVPVDQSNVVTKVALVRFGIREG